MNGEFEAIVEALVRGGGGERLAGELRLLTAASVENTQAILQNTVALAMGGGGAGSGGVAGTVWKAIGGGLGAAPIVTGLLKLFGGGKSEAPAPLQFYARPAAVEVQSAISRSGESETYVQAEHGAPQVTVNVQAMDSRSFLDHRDEIARAVREAMLNGHSLNDVVNE